MAHLESARARAPRGRRRPWHATCSYEWMTTSRIPGHEGWGARSRKEDDLNLPIRSDEHETTNTKMDPGFGDATPATRFELPPLPFEPTIVLTVYCAAMTSRVVPRSLPPAPRRPPPLTHCSAPWAP